MASCCLMQQLWILLAKNIQHKSKASVYMFLEIVAPLIYAAMLYGVLSTREVVQYDPPTSIEYGDLTTFQRSYILGYAPANEILDELMFRAARLANQKYRLDLEAIGFVSEFQMMEFVRTHATNVHSVYAFDHMTSRTKELPKILHLVLRPVINSEPTNIIAKEHKYDLHIMQAIMESYIFQLTGKEHTLNVTWTNKAKLMTLYQTKSVVVQNVTFIFYILMGFLISRNVFCIAHERESGVTKVLSRTGVNMYIYWLSWFITVFIVFWLATLVAGAMMFVKYPSLPPAYVKSDINAVLVYFTLVAAACTSYCIMGSVICHKAHTTSTIATCIFLGSAFPLQIVTMEELTQFFACILFNKNVHMTLVGIDILEHKGQKFSYSEVDTVLFPYVSVCVCGLLYAVIARILYHCVINRQPLWMILPDWLHGKTVTSSSEMYRASVLSEDTLSHLKAGIIINKLCTDIPAPLEDITLVIYENNVTVISDLDGNSSTTFLSVLTGETRPRKGSVKVQGLDIVKNIGEVKNMTSVCPREQSALFSSFTVLENLRFFYRIKSVCQGHHDTSRFQEVIAMFDLKKNLTRQVDSLSAAERRLLQIAIVYLGNSKILLFDYPTLDMDPYTKSKCWNVIRRNTEDKIVIVCTESIEEAEMVGDMIAVVSGGLMRSCGSLENIYHIYGIGYNLMIDKDIGYDFDRVLLVVTELVPNARVVEDTTNRTVILLPMHAARSFYHLLTFLDTHKRTLGIARFSMNTLSLEEAILDKSSEEALFEMNETHSVEIPVTTPKKFEMYLSSLQETFNSESNVDRLGAAPSLAEVMRAPTESDIHTASVEEHQLPRYTGFRLMLSQAGALLKKKILLSVCAFHLEAIQVIVLLTLAAGLFSQPLLWNTKTTDLNPKLVEQTIAAVITVDGTNTASSRLTQRYQEVLRNTDIKFDKEYPSQQALYAQSKHNNLERYNMIGASFHFDNSSNVYRSVALHSTCGIGEEDYFLPISITAIMNAYLYHFTGNAQHSMRASKLSESNSEKDLNETQKVITRAIRLHRHHSSFLQSVSLLMVPYFAVSERMTGFKHLQHMSGASAVLYWAVSLISDLASYLFFALLYPNTWMLFKSGESFPLYDYIELVTVYSGVVMLLYIYVLQFAFSVPSSAAFIICLMNYFVGDAATITKVMFGKVGQAFQNTVDERWLLLLPPCIMPTYVYYASENIRYHNLCKVNSINCHALDPSISKHCCKLQCADDKCTRKQFVLTDKELDLVPEIVVALVFHLVFWTVMLLLIEFRLFHHIKLKASGYWKALVVRVCGKRRKSRSLSLGRKTFNMQSLFNRRRSTRKVPSQLMWVDPGILEHVTMLQSTSNDVGLIRLVGVDYGDPNCNGPPRLNLLIQKGESYCFVDTEKSTASGILKLLSGRRAPLTGKIIVKGQPFIVHGKPSYTPIGYCMETDSVVGSLTAREALHIHAKLRGITDDKISTVVESVLRTFNLLDKADVRSAKYSSSDRRLLNIAVAVIGDPEIILLDDPFGNLDVVNKSLVWKALDKSMLNGSTIIMCSDKIREISDKVTVVVILLNGEPVCIGSPETIRNSYCGSYTLLAKLDVCNRNLPIEALIISLKERFPKCVIFYDHQDFLHMRIPYDDTTLPDVFALMESAKKHLKIQSYKLVHTNLAYVITAMQQRLIEESTVLNENDEDDDDDYD